MYTATKKRHTPVLPTAAAASRTESWSAQAVNKRRLPTPLHEYCMVPHHDNAKKYT